MKKLFLLELLLTFIFFFSCKDSLSDTETQSSNEAFLTLGLSDSSRTVLPNFSLDKMTDFVLSGTKENEDNKTLATFSDYSTLVSSKIGIDVGNWEFTLSANQNGSSFIGTLAKEIVVGTNVLSFNLQFKESGISEGSLNVFLSFPNNSGVLNVKAGLFDVETGTTVSGFDYSDVDVIESTVTYSKTKVPAGTYWLKFCFYGENGIFINTYRELIVISSGLTSSAQRKIDSLNDIFTLNYELNGGSFDGDVSLQSSITRKDVVQIPSSVSKIGYTFAGFYDNENFTGSRLTELKNTSENINLYAKWIANTNTKYIVKHYQQNILNDEYSFYESDNLIGTTDTQTTAISKNYEGFTSKSFSQNNINGDGSTVINIYYDRKIFTLSIDLDGGTSSTILNNGKLSGKYGATVLFSTPTKSGYKFIGWNEKNGILPTTFTKDASYIALWAKSSISISVEPLSDIQVNYTKSGDVINFVADSSYSSYLWQLDNKALSSSTNTVSIDTSSFVKGTYEIYLLAQKNGDYRSSTVFIKIE